MDKSNFENVNFVYVVVSAMMIGKIAKDCTICPLRSRVQNEATRAAVSFVIGSNQHVHWALGTWPVREPKAFIHKK